MRVTMKSTMTTTAKAKKSNLFWILFFGSFIVVYIVLTFYKPERIPTASMEPTIPAGSVVMCDRVQYGVGGRTPQRQDIIIFWSDQMDEYLCKRVIGMPGDTVMIQDGIVYINDTVLKEPYVVNNKIETIGPFEVPDNSYFVMGDNRPDSYDSRYWQDPFVDADDIDGRVILLNFE